MTTQTTTRIPSVGIRPSLKRRRSQWWHWVPIGISVLFIIGLSACGGGPATATATQTPAPTATPQPTATSLPTATPKPTTNPNAGVPSYVAEVVPRLESLGSATNDVGIACGAEDIAACRDALQKVHDETASFQTYLQQHPAPPCLQAGDTLMHSTLTDLHDGVTLITQGLDNQNTSDLEAGVQLVNRASSTLQDAATEFSRAQC